MVTYKASPFGLEIRRLLQDLDCVNSQVSAVENVDFIVAVHSVTSENRLKVKSRRLPGGAAQRIPFIVGIDFRRVSQDGKFAIVSSNNNSTKGSDQRRLQQMLVNVSTVFYLVLVLNSTSLQWEIGNRSDS